MRPGECASNARGAAASLTTAERVVRKKAKPRSAMAAILRDVPPGYHWGWFSREDPRMHLQTVDEQHRSEYKVWLETKGKRVFEPATAMPAKIRKRLEAETRRRRASVETKWVKLMIDQ